MNDNALIAGLVLIGLVLFSNFILYGIVRGFTRGNQSRWMSALRDSFSQPLKPTDESMDELHKKIEELRAKGDDTEHNSS